MISFKILRLAIWLLPLYLGYQAAYQVTVLTSMHKTYNTGESILAEVTDFRIKQIAAQTNGFVVLDFTSADGTHVNRLLSLPVQLAAPIQNYALIDIKYRAGASQEIVMTPTYRFHKNMVLVNIAVLSLSLLVTVLIALWATRLANAKIKDPVDETFTRVD
jgi:hypothetical protein